MKEQMISEILTATLNRFGEAYNRSVCSTGLISFQKPSITFTGFL